jgi:hypothetical protein
VLSAPDGYQTKVLVKILTSLVLTHNNFVHLRELKVLSESLIGNIKEKAIIRSLEKFDKQLTEWLAKDPGASQEPAEDERRSLALNADSGDDPQEGSMTPTRNRKRILFSQTMSNSLLDPDQLPLKSARTSSSSVYRSPTNKKIPATDDEDEEDTTLVDNEEDGVFNTVPESASENEADNEKEPEKSKGSVHKIDENTKEVSQTEVSSQVISVEIMPASSEDEEEETDVDLFSDASSVSSINVSKLPKGSVVDNSTDSDTEEADESQDKRPPSKSRIPRLSTTNRTSRSATSSPATSSTRSSRGSRVPTPVSTTKAKGGVKAKSVVEVSSPRTLSRSGRNNSPRIDYKTGKRVEETSTSSTSSSKVRSTSRKTKEVETTARSSTRKRNKEKTPESARSSSTSSPVKKDARRNLAANDSSDDFVESTPPVTAASGSTRSRRAAQTSSSDSTLGTRPSRAKTSRK